MTDELLRALALVLVIEGLVPFLSPARFKLTMLRIAAMPPKALRLYGLIVMLAGLLLLRIAAA